MIGGGHNGLVAAAYLARAGRSVLVLERREHLGGAAVSERPWPGVDARLSRYSYLVSLLPRAIAAELGTRRRAAPARDLLLHAAAGRRRAADPHGRGARRRLARVLRDDRARRRGASSPRSPGRCPRKAQLREAVGEDEAWEALFERPLGETLAERFPDDIVRGIALTDALIGTFAGADDASLRQNRCFLYHVIGNGDGHWDVPVGGMGALTGALADAARAAGAELRCGAEVTSVATDGASAEVRWDGGAATAGHVLANVAPAVLARLLGEPAPEPRARGRPAQAQHAAAAAAARSATARVDPRDAFAGTFHVNETASQLAEAYAEASAGRIPRLPPCEIYCHSLTDPSILGPELRAAGAQTLTCFGLHMPARLFAADPEGAKARRGGGDAALARRGARRADRGLPVAHARRRAVPGGAHPGRAGGRAGAAGREHLPPRPRVALRGDRGAGGHVGRRDRARERARVRRGRAARRRRQRHPAATTRRWRVLGARGG